MDPKFVFYVSERKIRGYLLSFEHPAGRLKAKFFQAVGFTDRDWTLLAKALEAHAKDAKFVEAVETQFGVTYVYEGQLRTPSGRRPLVRSVWVAPGGESSLRFVTAYPLRQAKK